MAENPDGPGHISPSPHLENEAEAPRKAMAEEQAASSHARTASVTSAQAHSDAAHAGEEPSLNMWDTGRQNTPNPSSTIEDWPGMPAWLTEAATASPIASTISNARLSADTNDPQHSANSLRSGHIPPAAYLEDEAEALIREVAKDQAANGSAKTAPLTAAQLHAANRRCERPHPWTKSSRCKH